jgi:hypothetical protein
VNGEPAAGGVTIVEVSPRGGLQNDPSELSTEQKIELAARAYQAGLRRIEVTSFVNPRAVPKLSDAERVVAGLKERGLAGLSMIGLVVNERGSTGPRPPESTRSTWSWWSPSRSASAIRA